MKHGSAYGMVRLMVWGMAVCVQYSEVEGHGTVCMVW